MNIEERAAQAAAWKATGQCNCAQAVDEGGGCLRIVHGNHEQCLVYVGCQDMTLLAEVR